MDKQKTTTQRRPSGFSSVGQTPRRRPAAPAPAPEEKKPPKKSKPRREKRVRTPDEKKPLLKRILIGALAAVLAALVLLMIFGSRGTYHQMPTITREEAEGSFAPEETPLPGVEEAIE